MKAIVMAFSLLALSSELSRAGTLDDLVGLEGSVGDYARRQLARPAGPLETPADTAARFEREDLMSARRALVQAMTQANAVAGTPAARFAEISKTTTWPDGTTIERGRVVRIISESSESFMFAVALSSSVVQRYNIPKADAREVAAPSAAPVQPTHTLAEYEAQINAIDAQLNAMKQQETLDRIAKALEGRGGLDRR